jgi:hypothetical protein
MIFTKSEVVVSNVLLFVIAPEAVENFAHRHVVVLHFTQKKLPISFE